MLIFIVFGSIFKVATLRAGGSAVALALGAVHVDPASGDPAERQLLNVVEEMAIASGIAVPSVYLLPDKDAINAFAAGYSPGDAVIGITRGALEALSRDELQGVIAHEFSHILNGDMRLNIRAVGVLHGILLLFLLGKLAFRLGADSNKGSKDSKQIPVILLSAGVVLVVGGYIGVLCARLIKSAISRQREFLADASAVQFTRHPPGIAGALRRILELSAGSKIASPRAEESSHMFFSDALAKRWSTFFQTHPPLPERIRRIDASLLSGASPVGDSVHALDEEQAVSLLDATGRERPINAHTLSQVAGTVDISHIEQARGLIAGLDEEIRAAARDPYSARALVFLLLFQAPGEGRENQKRLLEKRIPRDLFDLTVELERRLPEVRVALRIPLTDLILPALRMLSHSQRRELHEAVHALILSDSHVSFFEYILQRIIFAAVPLGEKVPAASTRGGVVHDADVAVVLGMLATVGHRDRQQAAAAFRAGASLLPGFSSTLDFTETEVPELDRCLEKMQRLAPEQKQEMLRACCAIVLNDRVFTIQEYELLRAIGAVIDCPIPLSLPL